MALRRMPLLLTRGAVVAVTGSVVVLFGCKGFFVPACQEYNDCSTTTSTTATTSTTSTTGTTTSTTGTTTSTTGTTTSTTGTTTSTTGTTSTTATTGTTGATFTTGAAPTPSNYVFQSSASANTIRAFSVNAGQLTPVGQPVSMQSGSPAAIAAVSSGKLLYAATAAGPIYAYTIAADGSLHAANAGAAVANVPGARMMAMDSTGSVLLVVSAQGPQLEIFRIQPDTGTLVSTSGSPVSLDAGTPQALLISPDNQHVFVTLGSGGLDVFTLDAAAAQLGSQIHIAGLHAGSSDAALATDSAGAFLYVAESESGIRAWALGSQNPEELPGSPFSTPAGTPTSLLIHANSHALYALYPSAKQMEVYGIAGNGTLGTPKTIPLAAGTAPLALSLDSRNGLLVTDAQVAQGLRLLPLTAQ